MTDRLKNFLTPYKNFVFDGYMISVPFFWWADHRHMDESELIKLATHYGIAVKVVG